MEINWGGEYKLYKENYCWRKDMFFNLNLISSEINWGNVLLIHK